MRIGRGPDEVFTLSKNLADELNVARGDGKRCILRHFTDGKVLGRNYMNRRSMN